MEKRFSMRTSTLSVKIGEQKSTPTDKTSISLHLMRGREGNQRRREVNVTGQPPLRIRKIRRRNIEERRSDRHRRME